MPEPPELRRCPLCGDQYLGAHEQHFSNHIIEMGAGTGDSRHQWICNLCSSRLNSPVVKSVYSDRQVAILSLVIHVLQHE